MALSCLTTISSQELINTTIPKTYYNFTFPTTLSNPVFSTYSYTYSGGSGSTSYLNGNYFMCGANNNSLSHSCYAMFLQGNGFYMCGVKNGSNNYAYNYSNGSVVTSGPVSYPYDAYNNLGNYSTGVAQTISTTYNGSSTSYGEYIQLVFPFSFIFYQLNLAVTTGTQYGPTKIRLLGSNDNSTWTQVTYVTASWSSINTLTTVIDLTSTNTTAYLHHRLVWEGDGGGNVIILNNCTIVGKAVV